MTKKIVQRIEDLESISQHYLLESDDGGASAATAHNNALRQIQSPLWRYESSAGCFLNSLDDRERYLQGGVPMPSLTELATTISNEKLASTVALSAMMIRSLEWDDTYVHKRVTSTTGMEHEYGYRQTS